MKRTITLILSLVMLLSVFSLIACANKDDKKPQGTVDENGDYIDGLPATMDFEAEEINFVFAEGSNDNFTARSISVDAEDTSDNVDAKIAARNAAIEQRLNVVISSEQKATGIGDLKSNIKNVMDSGGEEIDVIAGYQYYDVGMAVDGWLLNLNTLDQYDADYIDFDSPEGYWSTYYNNDLMYKNARYWITGDLALRYIGGMYCTFVNQTIYKNFLETEYGNIYTIVRNGEWTLDKLTEMAGKCYVDNGSTPDKVDEDDQLGYAWEPNDPLDGLAFSSMISFSTKYEDDTIKITLNNERTVSFLAKLGDLLEGPFSMNVGDSDSSIVMKAFNNGNVAFHVNKIFKAESDLQEMQDEYYIIPAPKFDSTQENYVTGVHDGCTIFGISYGCPNIPAVAATLEAMAAESKRIVTPVYYDSALKYKYTRDNDSADMIDLIRSHVSTDFAAVWSASISNIVHFFRSNHNSKTTATVLKKVVPSYQKQLDKLLEALEEDSE